MSTEKPQSIPGSTLPTPPEWIKEFKERTLIIDVIEKAFDPNVSDKEVRDGLIKAAEGLKDLGLPPGVQTK